MGAPEKGRREVPVSPPAPLRAPLCVPQAAGSEGGAAGGSSAGDEPALAFPLTQEERAELREAFDLFDPDGEGLVDIGDLKARSCKNAAWLLMRTKAVRFSDSLLVLTLPVKSPCCSHMHLGCGGGNLVRNESLWSQGASRSCAWLYLGMKERMGEQSRLQNIFTCGKPYYCSITVVLL